MTWQTDKINKGREIEDFYKYNLENMPSTFKQHLISAAVTFGSTFLLVVALELSNQAFNFNREALIALGFSALTAGVRSVAKVVVEWYTNKKF